MAALRKLTLVALVATVTAAAFVATPTTAAFAPNDPLWPQEWGAIRTDAPAAWNDQVSSPIGIAVLDTNIDTSHADLAAKVDPGYDAVGAGHDVGAWHGTAVASIAAGVSNNSIGITSYCWQCRVLPVTVLDDSGSGSDAEIAQGVRWAVDHGARIINISLAGDGEATALRDAISYAYRRGAVVIAAAGNSGSIEPTYPAADSHVIGVAATNPSDRLYAWSNRGSWVTIAAPGVNLAAVPGGGFFAFSGTSSAAPVVSGIVGLCLSAAPSLTPAQVRRALVLGATPLSHLSFGRVDAARTVQLCRQAAART